MTKTIEYPHCTISVYPHRGRWQIELVHAGADHPIVFDSAPTQGIAETTARCIARTVSGESLHYV